LNPAKQGRKAAFNRAGDAVQRSRWTFYEAINDVSRETIVKNVSALRRLPQA